MRLPFKRRFGLGYVERDVPIALNLGTLEMVCKALKIEFWGIADTIKKNDYDFVLELLYQGYITAIVELFKQGHKVKIEYNLTHAVIWKEYMSHKSQKEFADMMTELFGQLSKTTIKKKESAKVKS